MRAIIGCLTLALAGCQQPADDLKQSAAKPEAAGTKATIANVSGPPTADAPPAPPEPVAAASAVSEKTDEYEFEYSIPAKAMTIAPLRAELEKDRATQRARMKKLGADNRKDATEGDYNFNPVNLTKKWSVVTDTPRFLSLSSEIYEYSGGAHGNTGYDGLLWDRQAKRSRAPADLFDLAALRAATRDAFCDEIDRQRSARRGAKVERSDDGFNDCIDPTEQTLILGSRTGKSFDRIGFLVGPYAAGPYAEGVFEVTLPVSRKILDAVKPAYRGDFTLR